ncbi:RNA polymerase sigma factor [Tundrisphaera lichenicola]|uniref:RNA polymerase sigma factor n=1 Tax=Tundrisphaera lichenicola TaxID=2029860 RepID=UPI003EBD020D
MEREEIDPRLTQISTQWTLVFQAHQGTPEEVAAAQSELMSRYAGAVHRYLLAALRDPEAAEELDQEFAVRFLRGDFHRVDPARGRFRDFVKRALRNLMIDYHRRKKVRPRPMSGLMPEAADPSSKEGESDFDRRFLASWRAEIMSKAWRSLADLQEKTGQPYHTVLQLRIEHPDLTSTQLAERLSVALGRPIQAGGLRMALQRSRDRFVEFLVKEVSGGLDHPSPDQIEQELIDLGLHKYCKPAIKRRDGKP